MSYFKKKLSSLKRDESGSMAIAWAVSMATMVGVIAAAADLAMLQSANARSQSIADTTALAAAVFYRDNARIPSDREEGLVGPYTADELGLDFKGWVNGGAGGVDIFVVYDEHTREAIVTVEGSTKPAILQVIAKKEFLEFSSTSTVKFQETAPSDPASVLLVLDNSGSMNFADTQVDEDNNVVPGTQSRIDGLKTSANGFMAFLDEKVGEQDPDGRTDAILRTGMMAFSREIIPESTVDMDWGTIPARDINNMRPGGATNSAPPLTTADTWLNINEPPIHFRENKSQAPLKYLVLMTDGRNTVGDQEWVAREGTQQWRAWVQVDSHLEFTDEFEIVNAFVEGGSCKITNGHPVQQYVYLRSTGTTFNGFTSQRVECLSQVEVPDFDWKYLEQEERPLEPGDWEEGEFDIESNILTREQCDILDDKGVEIFTIAYALAPGLYPNDQRSNGTWRDTRSRVTTEASADARGLLQYCATEPSNFITADNADALQEAFDRIGDTIVREVIRIDS